MAEVSILLMQVHRLPSGLPWLPIESVTMVAKQRTVLWEIVSKEYWSECHKEFERLYKLYESSLDFPLIENSSLNILDIGAGFCGYNIWMSKKFPEVSFSIIDASIEDDQYKLGFQKRGERYCDFSSLEYLIEHSGIQKNRFELIDFRHTDIPAWSEGKQGAFDIVQSLYSWCFHYPYETYANVVKHILKPGGLLIVDCRVVDNQVEYLKKDFEFLIELEDCASPSSRRLVFKQRSSADQNRVVSELEEIEAKIEALMQRYQQLKST